MLLCDIPSTPECWECCWLRDLLLVIGPRYLAALVVFFVGTTIRVRSEEKLLREAFGEQFEKYAQRVPAILPGLY